MALAALIAITMACIAGVCGSGASRGRAGGRSPPPSISRCRALAVVLMSPLASETIGHWSALADRQVEPRGLHRPRLLHRRRVGDRLQRAGPAAGRRRPADSRSSSTSSGPPRCASRCCWSRSRSVTARGSTGPTSSPSPPTSGSTSTGCCSAAPSSICSATASGRLLVLRKDPRSRRIANFYLAASVSGIMACIVRITTAFVPPLQRCEAARWCGSSPACAARGSRWRRRIPGESRPSGSQRFLADAIVQVLF